MHITALRYKPVPFSENLDPIRARPAQPAQNRRVNARSAANCRECERIAREISVVVVETLRAADQADRENVDRRRFRVLKVRRQHELRTGHRVPA